MLTRSKVIARVLTFAFGAASFVWSQAARREPASPTLGKSLRYCNPLSIETSSKDGSPQGVSLGDVTIVPEGGKYYMFCTGGGGWASEDLVI